ncbi:MAG TPA: cupin domain-containing protein [Candidatus Dormibacteraeota bacterium]
MQRWTRDDATRQARQADPAHFTGAVTQLPVEETGQAHPVRVYVVGFQDGARTHWHSHAGGQILHVVEGAGRTQVRGEAETELHPGDVVRVAPGVEHWHGAAAGASMTHVAVSLGSTEWGGPPD